MRVGKGRAGKGRAGGGRSVGTGRVGRGGGTVSGAMGGVGWGWGTAALWAVYIVSIIFYMVQEAGRVNVSILRTLDKGLGRGATLSRSRPKLPRPASSLACPPTPS